MIVCALIIASPKASVTGREWRAAAARTRFMPGSVGSSDLSNDSSSRIATVPCVFAHFAMTSCTAG
jgi:hypothetical protein